MSYQVLARKWRPKTFEELVGQPHVSQSLLNALRGNRLHHGLIFSGARGVGKTSTARILAKSLRCPNSKEFVPCNVCSVCEDIAAGSSMDVIEIDGASNNGVDSIRELRETVGFMPSSGKYKVYIIDEVHMLSTSAFNALLKTLEEPPAHVIFIFATTEPQKIPVTILSRCQRFDFRKISTRQIVERLQGVVAAEGVTADEQALWLIARQADGSMRDSQSLLDQAITFCDGKVTHERVVDILGLTDRALLTQVLTAIVQRKTEGVLQVLGKLWATGTDPKVFTHEFIEQVRNLLLVKVGGQKTQHLVDLPDGEIATLQTLASEISDAQIHMLFDMALKGSQDLLRASQPNLVLEMLVLRMAEAPRVQDIDAILKAVKNGTQIAAVPPPSSSAALSSMTNHATAAARGGTSLPSNTGSVGAPAQASAEAAQPQSKMAAIRATATANVASGYDATASRDANWHSLVQRIKPLQPRLAAQLEHVSLLDLAQGNMVLGVHQSHAFLQAQLSDQRVTQALKNYVKTFWGMDVQVAVSTATHPSTSASGAPLTPKAVVEKSMNEEQKRIREEVENNPRVQKTKELFKTEIKSIKEQS